MARVITKIGDVFSVKLDESSKKYFQYIANDLKQLNSDVIRAFKEKYSFDVNPELSEITNGEVDFYAHCIVNLGVKLSFWDKVGKATDIGSMDVLFRRTNDYGLKLGEAPVLVSENWYVWKINEDFRHVGKLIGENKKAEIGLVINPASIVHRIRTGVYDIDYPE
jgi:hypothetical protein